MASSVSSASQKGADQPITAADVVVQHVGQDAPAPAPAAPAAPAAAHSPAAVAVASGAPAFATEPTTGQVAESPKAAAYDTEAQKVECTVDWSKPMSFACCGCFSYLIQLILTGASGSFLFGINLSLLNTAIAHIVWEFEWCNFMCDVPDCDAEDAAGCDSATTLKAFISTAVFIGAAIGSMTGGIFLGAGRRGMILLSLGVFTIGVVSGVVSNSFSALFWARLFTGYGVGLISFCVPTYMSEVTPPAVRGFYGVFHQLFITIGILVGTLLGLPLAWDELPSLPDMEDPNHEPYVGYKISTFSKVWWRFMLGFCILPVLLCMYLLGRVYTFETPYYYLEKGLDADAEMLMRRITAKEDVSEEMAFMREDMLAARRAKEAGMNFSQAWKRADYRHVIIFGAVLSAFQQFGGINVFIASSNALFQDAGLTGKMPTVMSNVMNLINSVMTLPAVPLIEKMGRKSLLFIGCCGMTIGVLPATICYWALEEGSDITMWLAIVGCLVFIVCFAATYGPILWVYLFEIYPTEIKGVGAGLATAVNWLAGIVMVFCTNYIDNRVQYTIFTVMCGLSAVIVGMWMRETKGRALGDSPFVTQ